MRIGRPIPQLVIAPQERSALQNWARRPKSAPALALRAKMILACAEGKSNTEVAHQFRITKQMVGKWRARFVEQRLDGLLDEPRSGTPRKVSGASSGHDSGIAAARCDSLEYALAGQAVRAEP
jgi:Winged helix-turn helix